MKQFFAVLCAAFFEWFFGKPKLPPYTGSLEKELDAIRSVPPHFIEMTEQLTEAITINVASVYPQTFGVNNTTANVINTASTNVLKNLRRIMGHLLLGSMGANANVTMVFQSSTANNGTFSNVVGGPSLTMSTTNSEGTIEMRADQVPTGNSWIQVAFYLGTNSGVGNTATFAGSLYGSDSTYKPAKQYDFSTNTSLLNRLVM